MVWREIRPPMLLLDRHARRAEDIDLATHPRNRSEQETNDWVFYISWKGRGETHVLGRDAASWSSSTHGLRRIDVKLLPCRERMCFARKVPLQGSATSSSISASFVMSGMKAHSQSGNCSALELLAMTKRNALDDLLPTAEMKAAADETMITKHIDIDSKMYS